MENTANPTPSTVWSITYGDEDEYPEVQSLWASAEAATAAVVQAILDMADQYDGEWPYANEADVLASLDRAPGGEFFWTDPINGEVTYAVDAWEVKT